MQSAIAPPSFDSATHAASELAEDFLYHGFTDDWKSRADSALENVSSRSGQVRFIETFRRNLSDGILTHRNNCESRDCSIEKIYAYSFEWAQEKLEVLNPRLISRSPSDSLSSHEFAVLFRSVQALHDVVLQTQASLNKLEAGQQVTYEDLMDEIEDLQSLTAAGPKGIADLAIGRITRLTLDIGIEQALVQPIINDLLSVFKK